MDRKMTRICTICARGGSKGVKNKNIRNLHGMPLIAHTILQAKQCGQFDCIAVSSDSEEILTAAGKWGADLLIKRPDELASDHAAKLPAIRHCFLEAERMTGRAFDVIVDLDATSPLRVANDITECVQLLERSGVSNIITGAPARRSPYFNLVELDAQNVARLSKVLATSVVRRQDAPRCYDMNASIYVWRREILLNSSLTLFNADTKLYVMPEDRSIDIDSELDFEFVEFLLGKRNIHDRG